MKTRICVAAVSFFLVCVLAATGTAELTLVERGVSLAPVVVFENAPPKTRRAAEELAEYIEKISGARPEVVEGRPDPIPDRAIWVGYQPALADLFPELDFDFQHPEEILIAANQNHLAIAGRDRWNPERLVVEGRNRTINGLQQEYGTANAVYTFLQDWLDVRWLWPGELGEDIIEKDTIALQPFMHRYHPQIRERIGIFRLSALGDNRGISHEWMRLQRVQLDSLQVPGGHAFTNWWDRYHEEHPEYFALQPDGARSGFPAPRTVKLCVSNPDVWRQWLAEVEEQLERDPDRIVFDAEPNDSFHRGHCVCEDCLAWDPEEGEMVRYLWEGTSYEHVPMSDRHITFANELGRLLRQRYPDKDYWVRMGAYGHWRHIPVHTVPDDNIIITSVSSFFLRKEDRVPAEVHKENFAGWGRIASSVIWRPNVGNHAGFHQAQPDVGFTDAINDFRFVAENNCVGMFFDTVWEHWPTQGPLYYVMAHMAWNPWQDGHAVLDDYYRRAFGPAYEPMKTYWGYMEETRNRKADTDLGYSEVYDDAFFARASGLLADADALAADAPEKYAKRIAFVRVGLEFTQLMIDTRAQMQRYRESGGTDEQAAEKARANWTRKQEIVAENLMNSSFMRPGERRARGLHPDYD